MATKSPGLSHFHPLIEGSTPGNFKARCKHSDVEVSATGKTTSNLITHLKRHHLDIYRSLHLHTTDIQFVAGQETISTFSNQNRQRISVLLIRVNRKR